ncbi:MAG TPA: methyltransferase domain-containing protein [Pseudonocardiaceae bacterium]|nr:methyltransferase domain-containing protein [Pseudonocardiaceae bacterium]
MTDGYVLNRTSAETARLQVQADMFVPHSAHLFRLAGITPGMRVLDLGSGAGDVSMLIADLVGPTGSVLGVDIDPGVVEVARERAAAAGLTNVSFLNTDVADLRLDEPVDALVGRLILMHLDEPAAVVRTLSGLVRPGGVVTFQDGNITRCRTVPSTPLMTKTLDWINDAIRAGGRNPEFGDQVPVVLRDAGLTVAGVATAGPAGAADSVMPDYVAESARSFLPVILAHGLATESEVDIDTLADRLAREMKEAGSTFWSPELVGAWARKS